MLNMARTKTEYDSPLTDYISVGELMSFFGHFEMFCRTLGENIEPTPTRQKLCELWKPLSYFNIKGVPFRDHLIVLDGGSKATIQDIREFITDTELHLTTEQASSMLKSLHEHLGNLICALRRISKRVTNKNLKLVISDVVAKMQVQYDSSLLCGATGYRNA